MTREQFIEKAGGVFTSTRYYSSSSANQKAALFWDFFDSDTDDYIHSVYAGVTVDLLKRKRKYSIEHIIPKGFLKDYLSLKGCEEKVIKGSTTNPLNFAAAHRTINSTRNKFPFDVEGDKITRGYNIELDGIYSDYGFDQETEWVIPLRTQGDLARAILYMCLVYGIKELYGEHLNIYRNWAKVDPPNIWELKYNEWVEHNHHIKNPFISDYNNPTEAFEMLDDNELMSSLLL